MYSFHNMEGANLHVTSVTCPMECNLSYKKLVFLSIVLFLLTKLCCYRKSRSLSLCLWVILCSSLTTGFSQPTTKFSTSYSSQISTKELSKGRTNKLSPSQKVYYTEVLFRLDVLVNNNLAIYITKFKITLAYIRNIGYRSTHPPLVGRGVNFSGSRKGQLFYKL